MWNKQLTNIIQSHEIIPGRALLASAIWHGKEQISILVVYAPNDHSANKTFWEVIRTEICTKSLPKPNILLGDFNLVEDTLDRLPPHLNPISPLETLQSLTHKMNLVDGWRIENPGSTGFTFAQSANQGRSQSRIDHIYIDCAWITFSKEWGINPPGINTDHQLISTRLSSPSMPQVRKDRWLLPLFVLKQKTVKKELIELGIVLHKDLIREPPTRDT